MIAVLLCAGFATRLYPLSKFFPKPLLPVAGKTALSSLLDQLISFDGLQRIHLVSNHRFILHFRLWLRSYSSPIPIILHDDGSTTNKNRRGALADLFLALRTEPTPTRVVAAAGDNIFLFSLAPFWRTFCANNYHTVLALHETNVSKLRSTGVLELTNDNFVARLHEKPQQPPSLLACPPIYFLLPSAWSLLATYLANPAHQRDALGHFIDYLCQRERVRALPAYGTRLDIGTIASYRAAIATLARIPSTADNA
ncbi:MAG: nucleotidyltransferase family protein [bacterium]|nr:nucleotidyltransferase family protein [bacterium]